MSTTTTTTEPLPVEAPDAATINGWTDRRPATIIERTARRIRVREDRYELVNPAGSDAPDALTFTPGGFVGHTSGVQRYLITADPAGHVSTYTLRANGRWVRTGETATARGADLTVGRRTAYIDFNF